MGLGGADRASGGVAYARAAYRHRGDPVLLLLADDMAEIEMEGKWPVPPDVESDLKLLDKLRALPGFEDFERRARLTP